MHEKNIKRIIRKQVKKSHPNWKRISKKEKKKILKEITEAVLTDYNYDEEVVVPLEELIGINGQQPNEDIMTLNEMADFIDGFYNKDVARIGKKYNSRPAIANEELKFINDLIDDNIINVLLSYKGYTPSMRLLYPSQFFRAELLKAIKYPEISYRKFCDEEYMGLERKENRRFLGLPLNQKNIIDHTQLSKFRTSLSFSQLVNVLVYVLHYFYKSGLLENCVIHGIDSTEIANDNMRPLYTVKVGKKKVRIYEDIDCDCGKRRTKRDKSIYVIGYRMHTLTAINPSTGHNFPLISVLAPANHHDSLYLKPLIKLAQAIGIEVQLITADEAYHDKDGTVLNETGVHIITPVPSNVSVPENVDPDTLAVTCHNYCEIAMQRVGLTEEGHEYKCNACAGVCPFAANCSQFRIIPFDNGHFQRMPMESKLAEEAVSIRKNSERPFNLLKKREGLEDARVRSQHALVVRSVFTMITTLLIEISGTRRKNKPAVQEDNKRDKAA